jgi:hypothetical protein
MFGEVNPESCLFGYPTAADHKCRLELAVGEGCISCKGQFFAPIIMPAGSYKGLEMTLLASGDPFY